MTTRTSIMDEGYRLDQEIKSRKIRLDEIKSDLADQALASGEKRMAGYEAFAAFSFADVYDPIDVGKLAALMNQRGLADKLFDVLKPDVTALRAVIGAADIKDLQGPPVATKVSVSFKPLKK